MKMFHIVFPSLCRRYMHNLPTDGALHTEPPIKEEQLDDYVPMSIGL